MVYFGLMQIISLCILGTIIDIAVSDSSGAYSAAITKHLIYLQSNNISEAVKTFSWYRLPTNELKHYKFFLQHSQRLQVILIGGVRPLNMQFCLSVSFKLIIRLTWLRQRYSISKHTFSDAVAVVSVTLGNVCLEISIGTTFEQTELS